MCIVAIAIDPNGSDRDVFHHKKVQIIPSTFFYRNTEGNKSYL
tara:strand:+ start:18572 stop:18700 length:129 start_codon:yes stop_codon:yes gene_type:complete